MKRSFNSSGGGIGNQVKSLRGGADNNNAAGTGPGTIGSQSNSQPRSINVPNNKINNINVQSSSDDKLDSRYPNVNN